MSRFLFVALLLIIACEGSPGTSLGADGRLRVPVVFSGGHEIEPVDHGRPVILIAGALRVSPEVFREAFSRVRPAPGGTEPSRERARENKEALMAALGPHGVTNDRLDEVSNYYRYRPGHGELWRTEEAEAMAVVENGRVTAIEITDGGSGYSSPPSVSVPGYPCEATIELAYGPEFERNGSVAAITLR